MMTRDRLDYILDNPQEMSSKEAEEIKELKNAVVSVWEGIKQKIEDIREVIEVSESEAIYKTARNIFNRTDSIEVKRAMADIIEKANIDILEYDGMEYDLFCANCGTEAGRRVVLLEGTGMSFCDEDCIAEFVVDNTVKVRVKEGEEL